MQLYQNRSFRFEHGQDSTPNSLDLHRLRARDVIHSLLTILAQSAGALGSVLVVSMLSKGKVHACCVLYVLQ